MSSDKAGVIVRAAGITYRQLDHWTRKGYLSAVAKGSGAPRDWEDDAVFIATDMARLVEAGLTVEVAAIVARRHVQFPSSSEKYVLAAGITLSITS
jgi:DNA-binding transcriptional MerR regulator